MKVLFKILFGITYLTLLFADISSKSNNEFCFDLYKKLSPDYENIIFSPYSITSAFSMVSEGATGGNKKEMYKVMHYPDNLDSIHLMYSEINEFLNRKNKDYDFNIANSLWYEKTKKFQSSYFDKINKYYKSVLFESDFKYAYKEERIRINSWVEDKTNNIIKNLLPVGSLDSLTRLVLCNAIYFKDSWKTEFDSTLTKEQPFHLNNSKKTSILMMENANMKHAKLAYLKKYNILEMQYSSEDLSMLIILPNRQITLNEIEQGLNHDELINALKQLREYKSIDVSIPKFKIETGEEPLELSVYLKSLGMRKAFDEYDPNLFLKIADSLYISEAYHKAYIDVTETGTEAAAATAIVMRATKMSIFPPKKPVFRADRPFIYMIKDNRTDTILFIGRLTNPDKL